MRQRVQAAVDSWRGGSTDIGSSGRAGESRGGGGGSSSSSSSSSGDGSGGVMWVFDPVHSALEASAAEALGATNIRVNEEGACAMHTLLRLLLLLLLSLLLLLLLFAIATAA